MTDGHISVLGAGKWGITLASLYAKKYPDERIFVWTREASLINGEKRYEYLNREKSLRIEETDFALAGNLVFTPDIDACLRAKIIINAIPSKNVPENLDGRAMPRGCFFVNASKGMIEGELICRYFQKKFPNTFYAFLGGPNIAKEILLSLGDEARRGPSFASLSTDIVSPKSSFLREELSIYPYYIVDSQKGICASELCSVLKQVYAIILGFISGLDYSQNTVCSLFQDSIHEIFNILSGLRYRKEIFVKSKVGIADLEVTYKYGRNGKYGAHAAEFGIDSANRKYAHDCIEGIELIRTLHSICARRRIRAPLLDAAHRILYDKVEIAVAIEALLAEIENRA